MKLSALRIADPCHEDWDAMPGDARERHCASCKTSVLNLSELSDADAEAALSRGGRLCVRFARDDHGHISTRTTEQSRLLSALRALREKQPAKEAR